MRLVAGPAANALARLLLRLANEGGWENRKWVGLNPGPHMPAPLDFWRPNREGIFHVNLDMPYHKPYLPPPSSAAAIAIPGLDHLHTPFFNLLTHHHPSPHDERESKHERVGGEREFIGASNYRPLPVELHLLVALD